jgi:UDP-N-acetylmuramoyl-tripeptide--D-alanyl-D-alanine ligase
MRFFASQAAAAVNGTLRGPDVAIEGVSFDSRSVRPGQLFVPIVAERDGHDFIDAALASGAVAYFTRLGHQGATAIEVDDTLVALMDLARARRWSFNGTVIGITGSVGKTTTKDLAWAALRAGGTRTWANERSFNNDQGLPTTLLNAPDNTDVMVLEMGMRGFGEIERLCSIAQPHIGLVTRVAEAHGDLLGGIEGVARAKSELIIALPPAGTAILNADDERVAAMADLTSASVLSYGEGAGCDVRATDVHLDELARPSFVLHTPWGRVEVRTPLSGRHLVSNAAAAVACVGIVGGDIAAGAAALAEARLSAMRMELLRTGSGALVINDCYNANPTSMRAALDALAAMPARRRFAVLGVMAEIADAADEHRALLAYAGVRDIEVIAVGTDLYGITPSDDPVAALGSLAADDAVLVKASRAAGLERVTARLLSV